MSERVNSSEKKQHRHYNSVGKQQGRKSLPLQPYLNSYLRQTQLLYKHRVPTSKERISTLNGGVGGDKDGPNDSKNENLLLKIIKIRDNFFASVYSKTKSHNRFDSLGSQVSDIMEEQEASVKKKNMHNRCVTASYLPQR
jgi:hypothetical protein